MDEASRLRVCRHKGNLFIRVVHFAGQHNRQAPDLVMNVCVYGLLCHGRGGSPVLFLLCPQHLKQSLVCSQHVINVFV